MAVEILTIDLSEASIEAIANAVARKLRDNPPGDYRATTQSNPPSSQNPQGAGAPGSQQQADPWTNQGGAPPNQGQPTYATHGQPSNGQQYQQGPPQGQQQGGHNCAHGPMLWQPPGTNRNTGESYSGYFKCPLDRGAQGRCRNVYPGR